MNVDIICHAHETETGTYYCIAGDLTRDEILPLSPHGQNTLTEKFILLNFFTMEYIVGLHMQSHSVKYLLPDSLQGTHLQ